MVRLTHIYTFVQTKKALKGAFRDGMELYWTANSMSEFDIAVNVHSRALWIIILFHLSENLYKNRNHMHMLNLYLTWISVELPRNDFI